MTHKILAEFADNSYGVSKIICGSSEIILVILGDCQTYYVKHVFGISSASRIRDYARQKG